MKTHDYEVQIVNETKYAYRPVSVYWRFTGESEYRRNGNSEGDKSYQTVKSAAKMVERRYPNALVEVVTV